MTDLKNYLQDGANYQARNEIERLMPYVYLESIKEVISAFCESKGYKVEFV